MALGSLDSKTTSDDGSSCGRIRSRGGIRSRRCLGVALGHGRRHSCWLAAQDSSVRRPVLPIRGGVDERVYNP